MFSFCRLGKLLQGLKCHVNLIPLNPTRGFGGAPASVPSAHAFIAELARHGVPATVRVRRGIDIDAGCGQLTTSVLHAQADSDEQAPGRYSGTRA